MMITTILVKNVARFGAPEQNRELFSALNNRILNLIYVDRPFTDEDWITLYTNIEDRDNMIRLTLFNNIQMVQTLYPNIYKIISIFADKSLRFPDPGQRIGKLTPQEIQNYKDSAKRINTMIQAYFKLVMGIMERKGYNQTPDKYKRLYKDIQELLEIDTLLTTEYDELVEALTAFDVGINYGIRRDV